MGANNNRIFLGILMLAILALALPAAASAADAKVNINSANADELALLPRVGATVAARIIDFREANGPFGTVEDLMLVKGIGERTFELIEPYVSLSGETTLVEKVSAAKKTDANGEGEE